MMRKDEDSGQGMCDNELGRTEKLKGIGSISGCWYTQLWRTRRVKIFARLIMKSALLGIVKVFIDKQTDVLVREVHGT
jgi:hypothetical protein